MAEATLLDLEACIRRIVREELQAWATTHAAPPPPMPAIKVPRWCTADVREMLGKEADWRVAKKAGVAIATVCNLRNRLGIEPRRTHEKPHVLPTAAPRSAVLPTWVEANRHRFGVESDGSIAKSVGVSRQNVHQYRCKLGIPEGETERKNNEWLSLTEEQRSWFGVVSDREIAGRIGCAPASIARLRRKHGITVPSPVKARASLLDAHRDLFGVLTDTAIAQKLGIKQSTVATYRGRHPELPRSPWNMRGGKQ